MRQIDALVTKTVLEAIENSKSVPWRKTWKEGPPRPTNLSTGRCYNGINSILLCCYPYSCSYWLTFNQCRKLGGTVRKGMKGAMILFPMVVDISRDEKDVDPRDEKTKKALIFKPATVFNVAQCEGIELPGFDESIELGAIESCEAVLSRYVGRPEVIFNDGPCYDPANDKVFMPHRGYFERPEFFYSVLFHEMAHSSGHPSRLNRFGVDEGHESQLKKYGFEELVAEISACMLSNEARIDSQVIDGQVAYLKGWSEAIAADPTLMLRAASAAQKAFNFMCPEPLTGQTLDVAA